MDPTRRQLSTRCSTATDPLAEWLTLTKAGNGPRGAGIVAIAAGALSFGLESAGEQARSGPELRRTNRGS